MKLDERADVIAGGQLSGNGPAAPGWMAFLAGHGLTQAQFDASGFGVDVTDSGLDNGTVTPNHYALYRGGDRGSGSRVAFVRLGGSPNPGSTIQGCDGHGNLNGHLIGAYSALAGGIHGKAAGYRYNLGIAPFIKLGYSVSFDPNTFTNPSYEDLQSRAYRDGMRISSNSGVGFFHANVTAGEFPVAVKCRKPQWRAMFFVPRIQKPFHPQGNRLKVGLARWEPTAPSPNQFR